ncbi:uncharacterized protein LOC119670734 [Teleopsis dalmanni]|uniref:uncharacterized protein LOC119670734 n=1 Tax=Teleopsis dalmanni TaxID=139649 RepID=UPI0018CCAA9F|nr:uncharacterized protein LOC119670734 [Teleopsis dalmanni]
MPWTPLVIITVLFGAIYGSRFMDNILHRPYVALKSSYSEPVSNDGSKSLKNYEKTPKTLAFGLDTSAEIPCHHFSGLENNFVKIFYSNEINECGQSFENIDRKNYNGDLKQKRYYINNNIDIKDLPSNDVSGIFNEVSALHTVSTKSVESDALNKDTESLSPYMESSSISNLPVSYYSDFYEDLIPLETSLEKGEFKRSGPPNNVACDCKIKNNLVDLGLQHYPRYLLNAVCQTDQSPSEYPPKCLRGSFCKPLEYKVKVLSFHPVINHVKNDPTLEWLSEDSQFWKFETVTVAAGCFCAY